MSNNVPIQPQLPMNPPLPEEAVKLKSYVRRMAQTARRGSTALCVSGKSRRLSCFALDVLCEEAGDSGSILIAITDTYRRLLDFHVSSHLYCFDRHSDRHRMLGFQEPERKRWILTLDEHFDEMYWDMVNRVPRIYRRIIFR
jgi:hypothetical protein